MYSNYALILVKGMSGHDNDGDGGGSIKAAPDIVVVLWLVDWVEALLAGNFLDFLVKGSLNKVPFGFVCFSSYPSFRVKLGFSAVGIPSTKYSLQSLSLAQGFDSLLSAVTLFKSFIYVWCQETFTVEMVVHIHSQFLGVLCVFHMVSLWNS